jgi:hypothetical protein
VAIDLETITHAWENADGSTQDGRVIFTLSSQVDGATEDMTVGTQPINSDLLDGLLSQLLVPNVNSDLSPNGTYYWVREEIVGATPVEYPITVPTGGPWDLWVLREQS